MLLICSSYWLSLEVVFLVRVKEDNSSVVVVVFVVDVACAGVVNSTSDALALALQIFVNRQLSSQMIKSILFRKKWLLHLLTTTTAFLFLLFLSGTRSETLFSGTTSFLGTFLWPLIFSRLASIQTLAGSLRRVPQRT